MTCVVSNRVDWDNMGMLQACQRKVLSAIQWRDLEHNRPASQVRLRSQIHAAPRAAAQFADQPKPEHRVAARGEVRRAAARLKYAVTVQHYPQGLAPLGKAL